MERGARVNLQDDDGDTALYKAVREGHSEVAIELKLNGADENIQNKVGQSACQLPLINQLLAASNTGDSDTVTRLLQQGVSVLSKNKDGDTGLHLSCEKGHQEVVKILLEHGCDINCRGYKQWTALINSSAYGHLTITKLLLQHGAQVDLQDDDGDTALIKAVRGRHFEVANELKLNGADENIQNNVGQSARQLPQINELLTASSSGDGETVNRLLQEGVSVLSKDEGGDTGLHLSCEKGHQEVVKIFLEHGCDINCRGYKQWTPLINSSLSGHLAITKLLLDHGVEVDLQDDEGDTALIKAVRKGHSEVANELKLKGADENIQNKAGESARQFFLKNELLAASSNGDGETVTRVLQEGVSVLSKIGGGNTGLHLCSQKGHEKVVKIFLDNQADINIRGWRSYTPLMQASSFGHLKITKLLLDHGAEVDLQDDEGDTALIKAVRGGHSEVVNELKLNGADENIQNNDGQSARQLLLNNEFLAAIAAGNGETFTRLLKQGASILSEDAGGNMGFHISAFDGHDNIVKLFLDHGATVNVRDWRLWTPLMQAADGGHLSIARLLIGRGADLDLCSSDGCTALMYAAKGDFPDIVSELLSQGAQEDVTNNDNETALQVAEKYGCFDVIKIFAAWHNSESRNDKLFEASSDGKTRLVRGLLIAGSKFEFRNVTKDQAIHKAARAGHSDVVRILAEAGADINSPGQAGRTPLCWAAETGQLTTARLLLDLGAKMDTEDDKGNTALLRASWNNHLVVVCELLDRHANRNIRSNGGSTPWSIARLFKYNDIALVLEDSEITTDNKYQAKVLLLATENANLNVVADLIKRGACIDDVKSPVGESPFQLATRFPQMKKQEYDQELSAYAKTGLKPKDTLENIVLKAAKKSNAMAKLFLSQKLSCHDKDSITRRIAEISEHCRTEHFDASIMEEKETKFYSKYNSKENDEKSETLLESCLNLGLKAEAEDILDVMQKNEHHENGDTNEAQGRIKEEAKSAVPSSIGLRDFLKSVGERYPWGRGKQYTMNAISGLLLIIAIGFYFFDIATDVLFSKDMFSKSKRNFNVERVKCRENFDNEFNNAIMDCKMQFDPTICMETLTFVKKALQDCYKNEERFSEPHEWYVLGVVSAVHVGLSIVIALIIWAAINFGQECGGMSCITNLPIPIITKFNRFLLDLARHRNFAWKKSNTETEKTYQAKKKQIDDEISAYEHIVNLSLIIEASIEASFQFFMQTIFVLPTVILAFTDPMGVFDWANLFNIRFASIVMSFASFSYGFYKIRFTKFLFVYT